MGKGQACIAVSSVGTCVVFGVMCFLMTSVNPPPVERENPQLEKSAFANVLFDTPPATADYGLERADHSTIEYPTYRPTLIHQSDNYNTYTSTQGYPSDGYNVMWQYTPPKVGTMWPTTTDFLEQPDRTNPTPELKVLNKTEEVDRETTMSYGDINDTLSLIPVKRSVKDLGNHRNDVKCIILNIANDSSHVVIQIELGSNDDQEKKISEDKITKRKAKLSMSLITNNNDELERSELAKNTIIDILQNDSVVVHQYGDKMSAYNNVKNASTTVEVNEHVTAIPTLGNQNNSRNYNNSLKIENVTDTNDRHARNNMTLTSVDVKNDTNENITVSKHGLVINTTKIHQNLTSVKLNNKIIISNPFLQNKMKSMQIAKPRTRTIEKVTKNKIKMNSNMTTVKTIVSSTKHTTKATLLTTAKFRNDTNNNSTSSA